MNSKPLSRIAILCALHALVDFICIFSLFHFNADHAEMYLLYNFCAFALQMPFGIAGDLLIRKENDETKAPLLFVYAGIFFCIAGVYLSPVLFGVGNALFHVGGGILSIHTDRNEHYRGRALGTFVAPGAFGVTLGILFAKTPLFHIVIAGISLLMIILGAMLKNSYEACMYETKVFAPAGKSSDLLISFLCFAAVILRSFSGLSVGFSWNKTVLLTLFMTAATALGKASGGVISAHLGRKRTEILSLACAAVCYVLSDTAVIGLSAVLFFNMSMPLTLEETSENHHDMPGFAFGLLTFGLFLGYLPGYYGILRALDAKVYGTLVSLVTMVLLVYANHKAENP
ncbi:MAG: hypothetical protein IKG55_05495 [Solobacterium sp.]|nr:hypothetical protein [Solobacterium sp.]